ncbi:MAGUK p55 subfamily member 4 [Notothenia coriiceps]|uniref:MAGUK p55 subfamily member 4 n=1 Tax=Notothenia coriiceps TaxID=8208 RepID=A0A6I9Q4K1_9TELE|nr:PREDICTED: MAGUK p55 subfamily member 4 [Notothenia coriiceps]
MRQAVEAQVLNPHCELGEHGLRQILTDVIEEVRKSVNQDIDGAEILHSLKAPWLLSLIKVYECLQTFLSDSPAPALDYASGLSLQLLIDIRSLPGCSEEAKELYLLLRQPHLQALLSAHDTVAQKDYEPVLPPMPDELPEEEEATRTVCLVKNKQPLGATIKRNENTGEIFIARVIHGGLADRSGLLHAGDRIIEVNGFPVDGMEPEQVIQVVQVRAQGTIVFKVVPITERQVHNQTMLYVRAMADYSPEQDPSIPCADAGMTFKKGDVLEVVNQTDALWWQAKKLPDNSSCAGLIPSTNLLKRWGHEVFLFLSGPSGVGVNELRRRLIEINPKIFQGAVPHTSRAPREYEESGREYNFISREIFYNMIQNNRFLEYGEYRGSLYGTSVESVRGVLNSGKICVMDIEPNAIPAVRTHELKAYIIYVKPPPHERLKETRRGAHVTTNYYVNRPFKDEDFQEIEESARKIESQFCQFFDHVIVNDELQDSCVQMLTAVRKAQDEPQWVPASWIRPTST